MRYWTAHGEYTIAKYCTGGEWRYLLWLGDRLQAGPFLSAADAKRHADGLRVAA